MKTLGKILCVLFGIFMIVGGIYCLFTPGLTYMAVGYVVGLCMVLDAIGLFVGWWQERKDGIADPLMLVSAILDAVFGILVLGSDALQLGVDVFIIYYIAVWLVIRGIVYIVRAAKIRRLHRNQTIQAAGTSWYLSLCLGILSILFGVLCMIKPLILASTLGIFIGLAIITTGASIITIATLPTN